MVLASAEGRRRYLARLEELLSAHFQVEQLLVRLDAMSATLRPTLATLGPEEVRASDAATTKLRHSLRQRIEFAQAEVTKLKNHR